MGKLNCMVTMTTSFPSSLRGIILASKKPLAKILPALAEDAGGSFWPCPCIQARIQRQDQNRNNDSPLSTSPAYPRKTTSFLQEKGGRSNENGRVQNNPRFLTHVNLIVSSNTHTSALTRHPPTSTYAKDIGSR